MGVFKILEENDDINLLTKLSSFVVKDTKTGTRYDCVAEDSVSRKKASEISQRAANSGVTPVTLTGVDYSVANGELSLLKQGSQQGYGTYYGEKASLPDTELRSAITAAKTKIKSVWERFGAEYDIDEEITVTAGEEFHPEGIYVRFQYAVYSGFNDISSLCDYNGISIGDEVSIEMSGTEVSVSLLGDEIGSFTLLVVEEQEESP